MVYSDEQRAVHVAQVRKILTASGQGLNTPSSYIVDQLKANGYNLEAHYVLRIVKKIAAQYAKYTERRTMDQMRVELEKNYSVHLEQLYAILFSNKSSQSVKIAAMREARQTYESIYTKRAALEHLRDDLMVKLPQSDPQYLISESRLKEVVDSMIRFGRNKTDGNTLAARTVDNTDAPVAP